MADEVNTLDELMSLDPLELTATNIDEIIAYHRKARASAVGGKKVKRESGPKLDLGEVISGLVAAPQTTTVPTIRRR